MDATAALTPAHPRKFNIQPLFTALGAAAGGIAGAALGMAVFAWSLNTPFPQGCTSCEKLFDHTVSILILMVVVATLGGLASLAFLLLRAGLRWLYTRPQQSLRWIAAVPYFFVWLVPLPLIFAGAGLSLASQLYAWFPQAIFNIFTLQGATMPIVLIGTVVGMLAGIVLTFRPQRRWVRLLSFLPAEDLTISPRG